MTRRCAAMQVSAKLFACALLPIILATLVAVTTFADEDITDEHLIQFMSSFKHVKQIVPDVQINGGRPLSQIYNHLNRTDYFDRWSQHYYACEQFFQEGGPVILVVVGASEVTELDKLHPVWIELAQRTNGLLFILEPRYYGQSYPSEFNTKEFQQYFNSDETLYDISNFINFYKEFDFSENKWIVVGEGHGGKLAAWTRLKFPHLVNGVVVVNGPLVSKLEDDDYFDMVSGILSTYPNVLETMKAAYQAVADDITNDNFDNLMNNLKLCTNPGDGDIEKNMQYMFWSITWLLETITKIKDTDNSPYKTIVLNTFADTSESDPLKRLKKVLEILLSRLHLLCIHVDYAEAVKFLSDEEFGAENGLPKILRSGLGNRQFLWQSCTDFGYMKTSKKENMFGDVPLTFFMQICKDVFGEWYEEKILVGSIKTTNMFYNGADIDVTKTLFINNDDKYEKIFTVHENKNSRDFKIINVPDVPDKPEDLTENERKDLREKYNDIFKYIQGLAGLNILQPPKVVARRVSDKADKRLIQFMSSFTNVKQIVPNLEYPSVKVEQKFNHLNRLNLKRWVQLHYLNAEFIRSEGRPIILVIGALNRLAESDYRHPVWVEIAQRAKALLIVVEQRYYGRNQPTDHSVLSYNKFFSTEQALYDIKELIHFYSNTFPANKWIIIGEGHGGKLAAWFRIKFPNLVEGAVGINAPLIPKLEFKEYFDVVNEQLSKHTGVMATIKKAYEIIAEDIKLSRFDALENKLKLCSSPGVDNEKENDKNEKNIQYMLWSISWYLGLIPNLYNTEEASYKTSVLNAFNDAAQTNPVKRLKKALEILLSRYQASCIHVDYEEAVTLLKNENFNGETFLPKSLLSGLGNREAFWLSCTEFGYMKTSTKDNMFGDVPLDFFTGLCKEVFGEWYDKTILEKSVNTTNMFYGGKDMEASNILFINHDDDTSKAVTISEKTDNGDFTIINVPDVPDTPEKLTIDMRINLLKKYDDIYEFIKDRMGITNLCEPNIDARRVSFVDENAELHIIYFMESLTNIKRFVPDFNISQAGFNQEYNHLNRNHRHFYWKQNYYSDEKFYKKGGPIILVVEALSALTRSDAGHPIWTEFAQRTRGVLFFLEPRYYGNSKPTENTTENYAKYLNSEQTLYDTAKITLDLRTQYPTSKVIVVGEYYAGNIAAWMKYKFPNIIDAAVVVNAPLIPSVEFKEYFELVNQHLTRYKGVMETIMLAHGVISEDIAHHKNDDLKNKLNLCTDPGIGNREKNIEYMLWSITWNLGTIMKLKDTDPYKKEILKVFADTSLTLPVVRLNEVLKIIQRRSNSKCIHVDYEEAVEWLQNPDLETEEEMDQTLISGIGNRPKFWEICTEFGHMKTSTKENMFGDVKLEFFIDLCKDVFGDWYDETILEKSVKTTNMFYGGKDIDTNNILFINYDNMYEKIFTISQQYALNRDFKIINIPEISATPDKLTLDMRIDLTQKYDDIYEFIKEMTGLRYLLQSNVKTIPLPDEPYKEKKKNEAETSSGSTSEESSQEQDE